MRVPWWVLSITAMLLCFAVADVVWLRVLYVLSIAFTAIVQLAWWRNQRRGVTSSGLGRSARSERGPLR